MSQDDTIRDMVQNDSLKMQIRRKDSFKTFLSWIVPVWQKKCIWQVTIIIQPALCHLGTSHFLKVLYNKIPKGQIRWPIFLFFRYMLVLPEKLSIFPKFHLFWILVFSCPKMTLITIFTRMTLLFWEIWKRKMFCTVLFHLEIFLIRQGLGWFGICCRSRHRKRGVGGH